MSPRPLSREEYEARIAVIHECMSEGFPLEARGHEPSARAEAARRLGLSIDQIYKTISAAGRHHKIFVDQSYFQPRSDFEVDELPWDGEDPAEDLIPKLKARYNQRKIYADAKALRQIRIHLDGPIGVVFVGDPHIDDPGCAWPDLEHDVLLCRDTKGMLAVDVGDDSNNWFGRLMRLYANQEITSKQSLVLIEWLMGALPWLARFKGNHDEWNTEKGDIADFIHRGSPGILEEWGARLCLNLPSGATANIQVRHDFPGGSQFNPAHAMVRETLFGYRDHILACGHRHESGYIPIWHNDPPRLCQGIRVASYKDFDKYPKVKGYRKADWARSMGVIIDPLYADNPVRYVHTYYDLDEMAEALTWRRGKFEMGKNY